MLAYFHRTELKQYVQTNRDVLFWTYRTNYLFNLYFVLLFVPLFYFLVLHLQFIFLCSVV